MNTLIGKKINQTQAFLEDGTRVPVTKISITDNTVLALKTQEKHGYSAVQLGFGAKKSKIKPLIGHVKKANLTQAPLLIREVRVDAGYNFPEVGEVIDISNVFKPGDIVKVTGTSKGKGFAGVVKRHNFRGGPRTHGQSDRERAPGSIGQTTTPGRVYRGKKMAGRMGNEVSSILNLQILDVIVGNEGKFLLIKGLVPGYTNSIVSIEKTGELGEKKFVGLVKNENEAIEPESAVSEPVEPVEIKTSEEQEVQEVKE